MVSRTPQDVMYDPIINSILNDLDDSCADCIHTANGLKRTNTFKSLDNGSKSSLNNAVTTLQRKISLTATEIANCYDGKAKDLNKLKACLTSELDALDSLEEINGRLQVLEDAQLEAKLLLFLAAASQCVGYTAQLRDLQNKFNAVAKKVEKAIKGCRDARIKGILGAGLGAIGICLIPCGAGIAFWGGITLAGVETGLGNALNANEETSIKKAWNKASTAGAVADGLGKMPKSFAPAMIIVTGAVDLREAFATDKELETVRKELSKIMADIKLLAPKLSKMYLEFQKQAKATEKSYKAAVAGVRSFKPTKGKIHTLPSLMK